MRNSCFWFHCIAAIRSLIRLCPVTITKTYSSTVPNTGAFPQSTFASWNPFTQRLEPAVEAAGSAAKAGERLALAWPFENLAGGAHPLARCHAETNFSFFQSLLAWLREIIQRRNSCRREHGPNRIPAACQKFCAFADIAFSSLVVKVTNRATSMWSKRSATRNFGLNRSKWSRLAAFPGQKSDRFFASLMDID